MMKIESSLTSTPQSEFKGTGFSNLNLPPLEDLVQEELEFEHLKCKAERAKLLRNCTDEELEVEMRLRGYDFS